MAEAIDARGPWQAELVPAHPVPSDPDLKKRSELLADVILAFEAAAEARGAPTDEIRKGQVALLDAFGLLGDAGSPPLKVVRDVDHRKQAAIEQLTSSVSDVNAIRGFNLDQRRRGLRPNTLRVRQVLLVRASANLPNGLVRATKADLEKWLDSCRLSARSRRAYISHLRAFYAYAMDAGDIEANPSAKIIRPRAPRSLPRPMPIEDLRLAS